MKLIKNIINKRIQCFSIVGEWHFYLDDKLVLKQKNLIVQTGLNFAAGFFTGDSLPTTPLYLGIGIGTTAIASTDTKLANESLRKIVSAKSRQSNMLRIRTYFLATEANGNWSEFGMYYGGSTVLNSGTLFNRILPTGGISKTNKQALTIEQRITFNAS
jgi:hypothetical protein